LDIPFSGVGFIVTVDNIGVSRNAAYVDPVHVVLNDIEAYIQGGVIAGVTYPAMYLGILAILNGYLNRWIALGTSTVSIASGSVSQDLTQITSDPKDERALLREYIRNKVPVYTRYAYLQKLAGDGVSSQGVSEHAGTSIQIIR
jgi:hypothetical protein